MRSTILAGLWAVLVFGLASVVAADEAPLEIVRVDSEISVDGVLDEAAWGVAGRVETWWETNPGDNVPPRVANVAYLAYDERFLYAGFEFRDPRPEAIRAPVADRDRVPSDTDYGGLILDTRADGRTAQMFLANPRGVQYDAITSDVSGEDSSPDFFWDAAGQVTADGWVLEVRIPFSTLRYDPDDPAMRLLLYRNHPRDRRYQMFSSRLPRDVNCFVCNARPLTGLAGLPSGSHFVAAPSLVARRPEAATAGPGSPLASDGTDVEPSLDVKWIPDPDTIVDLTYQPDFSQVESDVPQIASNERFALFFPEKRPFFLESVDLLSTPIQAVHTRTLTDPSWGVRATGKIGGSAYTVLTSRDEGGGSVIVPGSLGSSLAPQDFASTVLLGRWRRDLGRSFASFLVTGRDVASADGGGSNFVAGPDFEWRPNDRDEVSGQLLWSETTTPERPDLAAEWDGRDLAGHALFLDWSHSDGVIDWYGQARDVADEFRADNGFVPRVGFRSGYAETGRTFRPVGRFVHRLRVFAFGEYSEDREGALLGRLASFGAGMDGKRNSFFRFRYAVEDVRTGGRILPRDRFYFTAYVSPGRRFARIELDGSVGEEVDFAHTRPADSVHVTLRNVLRPTDRLELVVDASRRHLDVEPGGAAPGGRLLTATVGRLLGSYSFTPRLFLRLIGEWAEIERDPALFVAPADDRVGDLAGSALLAYKLDWQTVVYLGYAESRELDLADDLRETGNEVFVKVSYAFQR